MKVILNESQYILLVESIKKEKYRSMMFSLLNTLLGKLSIKYSQDPDPIYHTIYDKYGENVMDLYVGKYANKGCKKDLTISHDLSKKIESYVPEFRHKTFSKVLVDYVYEQIGEKCDCVQYEYNFKWVPYENDDDDDDDDDAPTDFDLTGYDESKVRKYNVKKKNKIKESVEGKSSLENLIYSFLQDDFYPDYNWGPELFDFYREDVEEYGLIPFYINDYEAYVYYDDGTLEIMPWVCNKLDGYFNDLWVPIFKSWFEENSGLKVKMMVDSTNNNRLLEESIDKNKKFLIDYLGEDFINGIEQITSQYDIPYELKSRLDYPTLRRMMDYWGPMYLVKIKGQNYLYQNRDDYEWFMDNEGGSYVDGEILEELGVGILGLRFSDIIDMYFD